MDRYVVLLIGLCLPIFSSGVMAATSAPDPSLYAIWMPLVG